MPMPDIVERIAAGARLEEIEPLLGRRFRTRRGLRKHLERLWRVAHANALSVALARPLADLVELPYTQVERGGVVYRIHGVVHDQPGFGLRLRPDVRDQVRTFAEKFQGPHVGCVLERGFAKSFGLPEADEVRLGGAVFERVGVRRSLRVVIRGLATAPIWPFARLLFRLTRNPAAREMGKCLDDLRHLLRLREVFGLVELPDPIAGDFESEAKAMLRGVMSDVMTEAMIERAAAHDWTTVHAVCGFLHEQQMADRLSAL
jgi:hypothetical protein